MSVGGVLDVGILQVQESGADRVRFCRGFSKLTGAAVMSSQVM